jgi:hypothetical protein
MLHQFVFLTFTVIFIDRRLLAVLHAAHDATRQERPLRSPPAMMRDPLITPAGACSPDADRDDADAGSRLPEWLVHLLAMIIRFMLERSIAAHMRRAGLTSWCHDRPDLPAGSIQALAASIRGPFGNAIAWMCLRRGIGPGHADWPELSRAIVAFGGSLRGFRAGAPARGLQWWEHPNVIPGMIGEPIEAPAATAMAALLSRQAIVEAPAPAPTHVSRCEPEPAQARAILRQVLARLGSGPPTGPPAVPVHQFSYA